MNLSDLQLIQENFTKTSNTTLSSNYANSCASNVYDSSNQFYSAHI